MRKKNGEEEQAAAAIVAVGSKKGKEGGREEEVEEDNYDEDEAELDGPAEVLTSLSLALVRREKDEEEEEEEKEEEEEEEEEKEIVMYDDDDYNNGNDHSDSASYLSLDESQDSFSSSPSSSSLNNNHNTHKPSSSSSLNNNHNTHKPSSSSSRQPLPIAPAANSAKSTTTSSTHLPPPTKRGRGRPPLARNPDGFPIFPGRPHPPRRPTVKSLHQTLSSEFNKWLKEELHVHSQKVTSGIVADISEALARLVGIAREKLKEQQQQQGGWEGGWYPAGMKMVGDRGLLNSWEAVVHLLQRAGGELRPRQAYATAALEDHYVKKTQCLCGFLRGRGIDFQEDGGPNSPSAMKLRRLAKALFGVIVEEKEEERLRRKVVESYRTKGEEEEEEGEEEGGEGEGEKLKYALSQKAMSEVRAWAVKQKGRRAGGREGVGAEEVVGMVGHAVQIVKKKVRREGGREGGKEGAISCFVLHLQVSLLDFVLPVCVDNSERDPVPPIIDSHYASSPPPSLSPSLPPSLPPSPAHAPLRLLPRQRP